MERLEAALQEALARNRDETARWTKYKEEQETAVANMKLFRDKLSVDIMVPIGPKAFMPGQLCHTNEILVAHSSELFSECTSQQAQEIAQFRIKRAEERLNALETEREMYQNKLDKPHTEGVVPSAEQREIIEEYDEEKEKLWMTEHKRRAREEKIKEAQNQNADDAPTSHEDVMSLLDNLEMMEELEAELDKLKIENDDMLEKLMLGEINPPEEKQRISHYADKNVLVGSSDTNKEKFIDKNPSIVDQIAEKLKTFNANNKNENADYTNNNNVSKTTGIESDDDVSSTSTEDIPETVLKIEAESKNLSVPAKIKFFKKKLKELEKEMQEMAVRSVDDIDEKINKMEVREYLCDYIELLQDELEDDVEDQVDETISIKATIEEPKRKKRIRFADRDEVQLIDKNQAANTVTRARIELSDDSYQALNLTPPSKLHNLSEESETLSATPQSPQLDKKKEILEKVEKSFEFISENQSQQDFNLVDKIINSSESKCRTLHINFEHSNCYFEYPGYSVHDKSNQTEIGSPADIYDVFLDYFPAEIQNKYARTINFQREEALVYKDNIPNERTENSKDSFIRDAYEKPLEINFKLRQATEIIDEKGSKNETLKPLEIENQPFPSQSNESVKSILKNKEKVQVETITTDTNKPRSRKGKSKVEKAESGFHLIMGEVVEKTKAPEPILDDNKKTEMTDESKNEPDPLPNEKFVDVLAPKKRISRFKQMRANS